jgi:hypothetical protein
MHEESAAEEAVVRNHEPLSMEFLYLRPINNNKRSEEIDSRSSTRYLLET